MLGKEIPVFRSSITAASLVFIIMVSIVPGLYPFQKVTVSFEEIKHSIRIAEKQNKVFYNNDSLFLFFKHPGTIKPDDTIDFDQEIVVAIFMGLQGTGGYWIEVQKVEVILGKYHVFIQENHPLRCMVIQIITYPSLVIRIPRILNYPSFVFHRTIEYYECTMPPVT